MIIAKVTFKNAAQMFVMEYDHVTEALTTYASDHPLGVRILPWTAWGRPYFPNAHSLDSVLEVLPISSISITNQIARRLIFRKGFDDLLRRPSRRRMFGDIEVNHSASFVRQHNEHKQHAQSGCRHSEEVDRHEIADVIVEAGSPRLGRCRAAFRHQTGNRTFRNFDSEFKQFPMNSWCSPAHVDFGHRLHQFSDIGVDPRPAWILVL